MAAYAADGAALEELCDRLVYRLKHRVKINLLALDFDQTLVHVHTRGRWRDTEVALARHVRPFFRELIHAADKHGLHLAVVTFSAQVDIIRGVLREVFGERLAGNIVIRGSDGSWSYRGSATGKQAHIASAVEELNEMHRLQGRLTRASTLLLDDDLRNVEAALNNRTRAVWCNPESPHAMLRTLARLE